jgi:integrase
MQHLTREQLASVLAHAKAAQERDWVLLLVAFWHGLRASEAISLTPANFHDGYLTVQRLKGSLRTTQPLVEDADPLFDERGAVTGWLQRHYGAHGEAGRLLPIFPVSRFQFYRLMRRYCRLAGIPQHASHPHVLKHSIAMQAIRSAGIENVRQYLGHRSISSTGEYLKVTDEEASLAVARGAKPLNS